MKNILVIGSTGQIGSELTIELRKHYGENVVAGYIPGAEPKGALAETGPSAIVDITDGLQIADTVSKYHIDTVYNLAALLSAVAESKHRLAWHIGIDGLLNVLEVAREKGCAVFTPISIGAFGVGAHICNLCTVGCVEQHLGICLCAAYCNLACCSIVVDADARCFGGFDACRILTTCTVALYIYLPALIGSNFCIADGCFWVAVYYQSVG